VLLSELTFLGIYKIRCALPDVSHRLCLTGCYSEVSRVLKRSGLQILRTVPKANVPIGRLKFLWFMQSASNRSSSFQVKFKDPNTGIHCDLNINDQLGSINTSLIQHYCNILPVLRPLLLVIKRWARPLGYNNPAGEPGMPITFSSYTLAIMTIGLLQVPYTFSPSPLYISASTIC
jgi:hypothetical protein